MRELETAARRAHDIAHNRAIFDALPRYDVSIEEILADLDAGR